MTAREAIIAIAEALKEQAIDVHAQGMALTERSARLRLLARALPDAEAEGLLAALHDEGLITITDDSLTLTSTGGDA